MVKYLLYQIEYRRWLFFALFLALIIHFAPAPGNLGPEAKSILGIVAMTITLVIAEPVPLPVLAFLIVVLEVLFRIATPAQVAQSFMSDSVIFIGGSLMLALAVVKQSLDKRILFFILRVARGSVYWTVAVLVALSGLLASLMGEHAVAAVMLPVALILIRFCRDLRLQGLDVILLMAVAYGCGLAAIGTPSGGARNAIMLNYWDSLSGFTVSYFEWMIFMVPLAVVQVVILFFVLTRVYPPRGGSLVRAYARLREDLAEQKQLGTEDWVTIGILGVTLFLWILLSRDFGLGAISMVGVLLCIITGVLNWEDINHDLNWGTIILYASIISIGLWMDATGAADWIAGGLHALTGSLNIHGGLGFILVVSVIGIIGGSVLATGPAIAILGPVVLKQAELNDFSPLVVGMVLVASCSSGNFTPMSSPACTIVYGSGLVNRGEYVRIGSWMALISLLLITLFARFYWPLLVGVL